MKKIEISKEEYELAKRINKKRVLKVYHRYYIIYDDVNQLKLMRYIIARDLRELCK